MKNIVVVGSNRGIGLEFCKQYLAEGNKVVAVCRVASDDLKKIDVQIIEGVDVGSDNSLQELSTQLSKQLNNQKIDLLIHNAGIMRNETLDEMNSETIKEQFAINSLAPLMTIHALLDQLQAGSKIGFLTSRMGSITDNDSGKSYGYRMSKTALNAAIKSLSIDLKDQGISVAALHPGYVKTDMTNNTGLIDTTESVNGLLKILEELTLESSGSFWHTNGEKLPW